MLLQDQQSHWLLLCPSQEPEGGRQRAGPPKMLLQQRLPVLGQSKAVVKRRIILVQFRKERRDSLKISRSRRSQPWLDLDWRCAWVLSRHACSLSQSKERLCSCRLSGCALSSSSWAATRTAAMRGHWRSNRCCWGSRALERETRHPALPRFGAPWTRGRFINRRHRPQQFKALLTG
jgi:hypothetical protein